MFDRNCVIERQKDRQTKCCTLEVKTRPYYAGLIVSIRVYRVSEKPEHLHIFLMDRDINILHLTNILQNPSEVKMFLRTLKKGVFGAKLVFVSS